MDAWTITSPSRILHARCSIATNTRFPAGAIHRSACTGLYRGIRLWAAAVVEAGTLDQARVIAALDHARIAEAGRAGRNGQASQHHVRMNMYIAQARNGRFEVVRNPA